jgi:uncharacterized glyoxalase superfamily metalloenzyme YdcJ
MTSTARLAACDLRREFSNRLSAMYAREVPLYGQLVEVVREINRGVVRARPELGLTEDDVPAISDERHGAIRLGREDELAMMARFFAVLGMDPVNTYDLSAAGAKAQPVLSTAFRPLALAEIELSPFRVFCSLLRPDDARFFDDADLRERTKATLARREIFTQPLRELIIVAEQEGGLTRAQADQFLAEGLRLFGWRGHATDRALYDELTARGLSIAADIACFPNPHLNHLTPNTLDIDALQTRMQTLLATEYPELRAEMKDHIEGPPPRRVTVLLRQTSYNALTETVRFDDVKEGAHTARFGEIEQRGLALTVEGRRRYDAAIAEVEAIRAEGREPSDAELATAFEGLPDDLDALRRDGLGHFAYQVTDRGAATPASRCPLALDQLVQDGLVEARPIRYEDFLPVSAAGIFASNLRQSGARRAGESRHTQEQLEAILERPVIDGPARYAAQEARTILAVYDQLGVLPPDGRLAELERLSAAAPSGD